MASSRTAVETLIGLIEVVFDGDPDHSLLANLRSLQDEEWTRLSPGGTRSVADVLEHLGWSKWMYEEYVFGSDSLRGHQPPLIPANGVRSRLP